MRVGISGPRKWKSLKKRYPKRTELATQWLAAELDLSVINEEVEGITSLQLGLDTIFANSCYLRSIPFTVILSCQNQDEFWDEENQKTFKFLLSKANKIIYINDNSYQKGCIGEQSKAITDWLREEESTLFMIYSRQTSKSQQERRLALKSSKIKTFRI